MEEVVEIPITPEPVAQMPPDPSLDKRRPRKVYGGMWGPLEIGALAAGALSLFAVIMLYVFWVGPSNREVVRNRSEADRLEADLLSARSKYGDIQTTEGQVAKLLRSADDFETRFLPASSNGLNALYQRLNGLIAAYGLTNTTGPDYQPLETIDKQVDNSGSDAERGRERFRSLFPGVYVTATVEGSYQNLRKFIREIETGNEFIVVSSVELAPSDTEQKPAQPVQAAAKTTFDPVTGQPIITPAQPPKPQRPRGKMHGEVVALRLEMAAYFRRPNFTPMAPEVSE